MQIAYVGNFEPSHSTETHVAATLEDLGHEVTRIQERPAATGLNLTDVAGHDLFLWTRTWPGFVAHQDLVAIRKAGIPSVSLHLDLYLGLSRADTLATDPFWRTDHVFTPDGDPFSAAAFRQLKINHHWLPAAVYKPEATPGTYREELDCDVAFVGSFYRYHPEWPYRQQLVAWLKRAFGPRLKLFGDQPYPTLRGRELNDLYASARVVVGDSLCPGFSHQGYWSDRVYETIGRGGFIIHPHIPLLDTQFRQNELVTYQYGDFRQLGVLIASMLLYPEMRERHRLAGYRRVLRDHTYHNRMETMLATVYNRARVSAFM
jgi:hypothetical protein